MNCGMECVKYLLFIFNFVFALGGLAILVCGVLVRVALTEVAETQVDIPISLPATLLIIIGAIIFIIAFFGCCGAIRESGCMIVTFAILLLTLLVVQIAVASYAFIKLKDQDLEKKFNEDLRNLYEKYYDNGKVAQDGVNALQTLAHCCGYNSYSDFLQRPPGTIPYSCCGNQENQNCSITQVQDVRGCKYEVFPLIKYYAHGLGGLALGIAAVELIGIIFSFCLANSIRNMERRGYKV